MKHPSIKLNLLKALIGAFSLITIITAITTFNIIKEDTNEIFNDQLKQLAAMVTSTNISQLKNNITEDNDLKFSILVFDDNNKPLITVGKNYGISTSYQTNGYKTLEYNGEKIYTYSKKTADFTVIAIQPQSVRKEFIIYGSLMAVLPLLLFGIAFGLLMWYLLSRGIKPINDFGKTISKFDIENIQLLQTANLPQELIPLENSINKMARKLKQNINQQKSFIEDAAHELRTPLSALNIQLDLVKKSTNPKELEKNLQLLTQGVQRSVRLVEQLLTITRLECQNSVPKEFNKINLSKILSDVIMDLYFNAEKKNTSFDVSKEDIYIQAIESDIYMVLKNIIDNAVKYSPANSKIIVNLFKKENFGFFEVIDFGDGISDANKKRVFDRFYRVSNHKTTGSGLGLSIVEEICKKYHFRIELKDNQPKGLRFIIYFELPKTKKI